MNIDITLTASGPVFDGRASEALRAYRERLESDLADAGRTWIRDYLPTQYMYLGHHGGTPRADPVPPGAGELQASVHEERRAAPDTILTTDPVTYGPWIEGISERNAVIWPHRRNPPPRRFPGYHAFRLAAQELNAEATTTAERVLPPYLQVMNG